jgi:hypothetical protein
MIRRLPEILSIITVCCLILMVAGYPMSPPDAPENIFKIYAPALETPSPRAKLVFYRPPARAALLSASKQINCLSDNQQ